MIHPDEACSHARTEVVLTPELKHHGKEICSTCGKFLRWVPKPDSERAHRPASHRDLVKKFSRGFCELCLTREEALPPGQVLEGHHVIEFKSGCSSTRENLLIVCSACHALIHWRRADRAARVPSTPVDSETPF